MMQFGDGNGNGTAIWKWEVTGIRNPLNSPADLCTVLSFCHKWSTDKSTNCSEQRCSRPSCDVFNVDAA